MQSFLSSFAAIVEFNAGYGGPATTFADGTFSHHLSGIHPDGFYYDEWDPTTTTAYNGFGQNHETINFNADATLNSLSISTSPCCYSPTTLTINLFGASNNLLASQAAILDGSFHSMTFGTNNVRSISFDFTGGYDAFREGRHLAWYYVKDVDYTMGSVSAVPEPESYALMLAGLGLMGAIARHRRAKQA